ncbi:MAG: flagellar basal body P-ring protein FlgI [Burkholderiaceae bacterium]|jgi:flagellar P-ring protein precursor FlgI|nr:flagellar basal body P-ring protein FlgI [Burkholderiaceae bacterium]MEB2317792.1 flagellar basal body P-ring protein FlgI [Pseudomonadota bacterium]
MISCRFLPGRRTARPLGRLVLAAVAVALGIGAAPAGAERIKELATVQGVRSNQLIGYGLMVGLDGSGDQSTQAPFTVQSMQSMLSQLGIVLPPGITPQLKNSAAVMVTAQLPAYAQPGQQIDVTVSSLGNAKSLRGGTLLLTPLRGADGEIYAMAQGNMVVGGAGAAAGGSQVTINHLSAGRVPGGATVERAVPNRVLEGEFIHLELEATDFSTAQRVADAVNARFGQLAPEGVVAHALDPRVIRVRLPQDPSRRVGFMAELELIDVTVGPAVAKVIVNARTGSVVMNQAVSLETSAVAHGNLSVTISSTPMVSQPNPFSQGSTVAAEMSDITIRQEGGALMVLPGAARLSDVVKALNALGASAQDLIAILQALKAAGSLKAELEII